MTEQIVNHIIKPKLSMEDINTRIKQEVCYETLQELTDAKLMCEYKDCNSVKNEIKKLSDVLEKYIDEETKQKIIQEYLLQLIPAGTKGVIRGNKFNNIVKQFITKLPLDIDSFEICFEKKCEGHFTTEIPDWYILEKLTNKIIIGMNQLDLWGGGQQLNRGLKYIENDKYDNENSKLLCVVCNEIQFKSKKNKAYKLFEIGFANNTLCYLNNLQNIITSFFITKIVNYNQLEKKNTDKNKVLIDKAVKDKIELNMINQQIMLYIKTKQTKGLNRNIIDKYYTKDDVVDLCLNFVKKYILIKPDELIIEPSAGNGSFITGIKSITSNFKFYDLEPDNNEIIKQDYLLYDYDIIKKTFNKIHIIGNPPFGRQSSLAIKFIKKSCEFCDSISFILPKSFKKDSLKKTFSLNFHLIFETDLPKNSFLVNGKEHNVETIFQIWEKKDILRTIIKNEEPLNFVFVGKTENPDISFRRVGVNAGTIDKKINEKSIQSHYFIKFTNGKTIDDNMNKLSTITYDFNNTVGPKSISKQELIYKFNPLLKC